LVSGLTRQDQGEVVILRQKKPFKAATDVRIPNFLSLGGRPILDFCNTVIFHGEKCEERLVSPSAAESFYAHFFHKPVSFSRHQFLNLKDVRREIREFFDAVVTRRSLEKVTEHTNKFLSRIRFQVSIDPETLKPMLMVEAARRSYLDVILVDLFDFLRELEVERLKKCKNPNCSHFFHDTSKNNTRSWCSMTSCGNLMKARAFYKRKKTESKALATKARSKRTVSS
jgi:predicted RNA-binding Zn ribbon-like protein